MPTKAPPALAFDVHPSVSMIQKWVAELPQKSGRSLDEWADLVRKSKLATAKEKREWLKAEYGHGTNTAWWIVEYSEDSATWDADPRTYLKAAVGYFDEMFLKGKEWQRPIAETVIAFVRTLGADVKVCPCKTIVPFYRNHVFAELKPATKTRLELSFALGDLAEEPPLKRNPRANDKDRLRHTIDIAGPKDFGAAAKKYLKLAYKLDA
jgi:hypothetical protein